MEEVSFSAPELVKSAREKEAAEAAARASASAPASGEAVDAAARAGASAPAGGEVQGSLVTSSSSAPSEERAASAGTVQADAGQGDSAPLLKVPHVIAEEYVKQVLSGLLQSQDLKRYVL